jgi:hypothetical protein
MHQPAPISILSPFWFIDDRAGCAETQPEGRLLAEIRVFSGLWFAFCIFPAHRRDPDLP